MDLVKSLILNLSLLITLSFVSSLIYEKFYKNKNLNNFLQILIFCGIVIYSIHNPVIVAKVFHFDGRTILISISTLFFGWTVGIAVTIASIFARLALSTVNIYTTMAAAILPFLLGCLFHILIKKKLFSISPANIFIFGLLNSLAIFFVLFLISPIKYTEFIEIQRAALLVFPIITMLVGLVINSGISKTNLLQRVQESESLWKATFHSINEGIIILDLNGRIVNINDALRKLFNKFDVNHDIDKNINDVLEIKDFETKNKLEVKFNLSLGQSSFTEFIEKKVIIHYNDKNIPAIINLTNITDKSGNMIGFVLVIRDIRKEIEDQEKIISSERTFKGVFNSIQEAIYILNSEGIFIDVNNGALNMYGYEKQDFIGSSPAFLSAEGKNDNLDLSSILNKAYDGEPQIFEFWGKKKDGTVFPKIVSLYPGEYFGKKVIIAVAVDISNIRFAQEKLIEQEKLLRVLINATPDIIYVKDGTGKWIELNKGMVELLGVNEMEVYDKDNLSITNSLNTSSQEILIGLEKIEEKTWWNKSITRTEHSIKLHNGYLRYFDIITIPLFNDDGSRKNMILIGRDITLKKRDEEEKQIALNKLSTVIENFDDGVLLEDQFGKIEFVNDNYLKLFKVKHSKENLKHIEANNHFTTINQNLFDSEFFLDLINDCKTLKSSRLGMEVTTKDGRIIEANYFPIFYEKALVNHLWIFRNITEPKMYEKKLKAQITELEKFNKSMVERELKMIELKKEVNDLLSKSGLSPKYTILD